MIRTCLYLLGLTCCLPMLTYGQNQNLQDVIYMHDGGIWRGDVIESDTIQTGTVKMQIAGGSVIVIPAASIDSMTREPVHPDGFIVVTSPYYNFTSLGALFGEDNDIFLINPSFEIVNGYRWKWGLLSGVAVSTEYVGINVLQVAADIRYIFTKYKTTPFTYANCGINMPLYWQDENLTYSNGWTAGWGVGMLIRSRANSISFFTSLGYKYYNYSKTVEYPNEHKDVYDYKINKLNLRIGFAF